MRRLILSMLFVAAGGISARSISQVVWQNPLPTGGDLYGVFFLDTLNGWCVGNAGTVARTPDGGETWGVQESNTEHDLYTVYFVDALHGWAAGDRTILITTDGGGHWVSHEQDAGVYFEAIFFTDFLHGWACGGNIVVRTTDGGSSWLSTVIDSADEFRSIVFLNTSVGWAAGINTLYKTTDGGITWIDLRKNDSFSDTRFLKIVFANDRTGWLTGTKMLGWAPNAIYIAGYIWKSVNGGETWKMTYADSVWFSFVYPYDYFSDFVFADSVNGFFYSEVGSFKTSDGGVSWHIANSGPGFHYAMPDRSMLYTVGSAGMIAKSTDTALSWRRLSKGTRSDMNSIQFFDTLRGVASSGSSILRTEDGGENWNVITSQFEDRNIRITGMKFVDSMRGWVSAQHYSNGVVFGTTDGGYTWTQQMSDSSYYRFWGIHFSDAKNGIVVGSGEILRTTNGGETWSSQFFGFGGVPEFFTAFLQDSMTGWAGGLDRLYFTSDAGHTWRERDTLADMQYYGVLAMVFTSPRLGWMAGYDWGIRSGFVVETVDSGRAWKKVPIGYDGSVNGLCFLDNKRGWAVGDGGVLASTHDGGATWDAKPLHHMKRNLQGVFFVDYQKGWVVGESGTIISVSGNGGVTRVNASVPSVPAEFRLYQNYPNPFNPTTMIRFEIPVGTVVVLKVFNILGVEIATLGSGERPAGRYEVEWVPKNVASGIYFYRLTASTFTQTRAMMLIK